MEIGSGVEDGICFCEDTQQGDGTSFVLPDNVKASFRQEVYERSYKVTSNAECAVSCQDLDIRLYYAHCVEASLLCVVKTVRYGVQCLCRRF